MGRYTLSAFLWLIVGAGAALAQTTAFTYQGQLTNSGQPANGSYDLQFGLFGAASGGAQIASTLTVAAVPVSNGVFTVQLDFGISAFPGANRFLEIAVRPADSGSYTTLAPRQQISSTPYAIRTLSAASADTLSSTCVGCVTDAHIGTVAGSKITGTIPAASVPTGSGNYIQNTTAQQVNANFNISGSGTVGGDLTVNGTLNANIAGNFIQNQTTPQDNANFNVSGNGTLGGSLSVTGSVGIGATNPPHKLTVSGGPPWTANLWLGSVALDNAAAMAWEPNQSGQSFGIGQTNGGLFFFRSHSAPGMSDSQASYDLSLTDSGDLGAFGHASQARDKGGWVKAMAYIDEMGNILRCYNSQQTGSAMSTVPCGLTVTHNFTGFYGIDFGFEVDDRFISLTTQLGIRSATILAGFAISDQINTLVEVEAVTFQANGAQSLSDAKFMIFVY